MKYAQKCQELGEKCDSLYSETKALKKLIHKKAKEQKQLKENQLLQKLILKRKLKEIQDPGKGWVMTNYEKDLEKGWQTFRVPEEPEKPKEEPSPTKPIPLKLEPQEESEPDELPIIKKKRGDPVPLIPEVEEAKRLLHVLLKNRKKVWPFEEPVDPITLGIPDYPQIIKKPMDLGTIRTRLHEGFYNSNLLDFVDDVRLVFMNAVNYNEPKHHIYWLAVECSNLFEKKLEKSKLIRPPLPLGYGSSSRWTARLGWRRASLEETFVWNAKEHPKDKNLARRSFKLTHNP